MSLPNIFPLQLSLKFEEDLAKLVLKAPQDLIYSSALTGVSSFLLENLPSIYSCECFNDRDLSFDEEMKDTELGHLFEHIVLEYLCIEKLENGEEIAEYEGRTSWNWDVENTGVFHIDIKVDSAERGLFMKALDRSAELLGAILRNREESEIWDINTDQLQRRTQLVAVVEG